MASKPMQWAYGVTTVPRRRADLLPATLDSLRAAGFDKPHLFVDGATSRDATWYEDHFQLSVTSHYPALRVFSHWMLSAAELYARNPHAKRFAIFQDDIMVCRNLRAYLEDCPYPERGYLNLYTALENEEVIAGKPYGWYEAADVPGRNKPKYHGRVGQGGKGALGLVFDRQTLTTLLGSQKIILRPRDVDGWRRLDGAIVTALNTEGWREYIHNPSLVQHRGMVSTILTKRPQPLARTFPGPDTDALQFLQGATV